MSIRSIDEIIKLSDLSKNPEKIAYKKLVKQLDPQIKERARRFGSITFRTPVMLWGYPVFDKNKVERKIIKHYTSIGFEVVKKEDGDIIIRWHEDADSDEVSNSSGSDENTEDELEEEENAKSNKKGKRYSSDSDSEGEDTIMNVVVGNSKN
jgi:hypothetical protein